LLNLAAWFRLTLGWDPQPLLWALFALNSLALVAWEAAHAYGFAWLRDSWPPRLIAIASGVMATILAAWAIFGWSEGPGGEAAAGLAWLVWLAAIYAWYRRVRPDLFMLAGGVLSLIVVVALFLGDSMLEAGSGAYLVIGLVVIGMAAGGAWWLKAIDREQDA
jgi:hypothetical protein